MLFRSGLTDEELDAFIMGNRWKFARTMPKNPHHYIVKDQCTDAEMFIKFVMMIKKFGYIEYFWGKPYTMFNFTTSDGVARKYWYMGWSLFITVIINRKDLTPGEM